MKRKSIFFIYLASTYMFAALVVGVAAQQPCPGYPHVASLSQYPMTDRAAEIALARSACSGADGAGCWQAGNVPFNPWRTLQNQRKGDQQQHLIQMALECCSVNNEVHTWPYRGSRQTWCSLNRSRSGNGGRTNGCRVRPCRMDCIR